MRVFGSFVVGLHYIVITAYMLMTVLNDKIVDTHTFEKSGGWRAIEFRQDVTCQ